jgi:hypothetical protein
MVCVRHETNPQEKTTSKEGEIKANKRDSKQNSFIIKIRDFNTADSHFSGCILFILWQVA